MKIRTDFVTNSSSSSYVVSLFIEDEDNTLYKLMKRTVITGDAGDGCIGSDDETDVFELYKNIKDELYKGKNSYKGKLVKRIILEELNEGRGECLNDLDDPLKKLIEIWKRNNEIFNADEETLNNLNLFLKGEYNFDSLTTTKYLDPDTLTETTRYKVGYDLIYGNKGAVDNEKSIKNKVSYLDSKPLYRYTPDKITRCGLTQREVLKYFTSTENYYVNSHVEVEFDDYQRAFYNCKVPVRIGSIVIVDKENTSVKAMVVNILGKFVSNTKLITKKYVPTIEELKNMPNLTYYLTENQKSCVVDAYNQSYDVIIIPDTYKNLPVIDIANDVFKYKDIKEITFSKNIKIISEKTIFWCKKLEKIVFSHGVEQIENYAICNCDMLKCIELPKSLKSIGENALNFCNVEEIYYNGTLEDWKKIKIVNYNSFLQSFSKLYVLDETGDITYNDKKYKLYIGPRW